MRHTVRNRLLKDLEKMACLYMRVGKVKHAVFWLRQLIAAKGKRYHGRAVRYRPRRLLAYFTTNSMDEWASRYTYNRFKSLFRCTKESFKAIVEELTATDAGHKYGDKAMQLWQRVAIALLRFGSKGATLDSLSDHIGWSTGLINESTAVVIDALLELKAKWIRWPTAAEREASSQHFENKFGFRGMIGAVDGTLIGIQELTTHGQAYFDRKKRYSFGVILVCDQHARVVACVLGPPGSWHDARIWARNRKSRPHDRYHSEGQYLLGDPAFTGSSILMTAFTGELSELRRLFNEQFSRARVVIEHTNGEGALCVAQPTTPNEDQQR